MRELESSERLLLNALQPINALQLPPLQLQPSIPSILPLPQFLTGADSTLRDRPLPLEPPSQNPNSGNQRDGSFPSAFQRHSSPPASSSGVTAPSGLKNGVSVNVPAFKLQGPPSPSSWLLNLPNDLTTSGKKEGGLGGIVEERSYPPLLPSLDGVRSAGALDKAKEALKDGEEKKRRVRVKWTDTETAHLFHGVKKHGVGNWMKILKDPAFQFNNRSSVDLKDRFRTLYPQQYNDAKSLNTTVSAALPPPPTAILALTNDPDQAANDTPSPPSSKPGRSRNRPHSHVQVLSKLGLPLESSFPKAKRRSRLPFTAEEDERLLKGYMIHGATWTKIHSDPVLSLGHRRSTDLRDRFRTRFPEKYAEAGFKGRPKVKPPPRRSGPAGAQESEGSDSSVGNNGMQSSSMNHGLPENIGGQTFNPISGLTLPHPSSQQHNQSLPPLQHNDPLPQSLEDIMNSTTTLNDSPPANTKDEHLSFLIHNTPSIFELPSLPPLNSHQSSSSVSNSLHVTSGPSTSDPSNMPPLFPLHPDNFSSSLLDFEFASSATSSAGNHDEVGEDDGEEDRGLGKGLGWEDLATRPIFDLGGDDHHHHHHHHHGLKDDEGRGKRMRVR